jgi:hypothetical protein
MAKAMGADWEITCSCPTGKKDKPCVHAASVWLLLVGDGVELAIDIGVDSAGAEAADEPAPAVRPARKPLLSEEDIQERYAWLRGNAWRSAAFWLRLTRDYDFAVQVLRDEQKRANGDIALLRRINLA